VWNMSLSSLPPVSISNDDFQAMLYFSRCIFHLKKNSTYIQKLESSLPEIVSIKTDYPSALMGFDFHLTEDGPKLIEVNNNAAGLWSWKTGDWLEQDEMFGVQSHLCNRINDMFPEQWRNIVILDEHVEQQFFYPEMKAYANILSESGRHVIITSPEHLQQHEGGCLYFSDKKIDGIYNRHTDFYLKGDEMKHIHNAYIHQKVGLSPHPRSYGLIADKARMVDWWAEDFFKGILSYHEVSTILNVVPEIKRLSDWNIEDIWLKRKKYVFKPTSSHGGKGVLIGKSLRNKRFQLMLETAQDIVVQEFVPAPTIERAGITYKYDIRLYMCGETLIGLAARLFQGSVTNFSHPNSGFYPVRIV